MELTNTQLEERIVALENKYNEIQLALNNVAAKSQLKQLAYIRQNEIDALTQRVTDLESSIAILQQ